MSVTVYITVDLFHYYWNRPDDRQLWLAVNAHVSPTESDVLGWVRGSEHGSSFTYELVRETVFADQMITVNLADDVDIQLIATDKDGEVLLDPLNERNLAVDVLDGAQFARDNLDLQGGGNIEPMREGPFVRAFNHGARQAERGHTDIVDLDPDEPAPRPVPWDRLMQMIDMAQAGGARRRLRQSVAQHVDRVDIMRLPFASEPDVTVTNLHSLNGLMFKLGDAHEIPSLSAVRGLKLTFTDGAGVLASLDLAERPQDAEFLKRFFSNLSGNLDYGQLRATWLGEISRRVYVRDTAMVFAHRAYPDGTHWFRRRREERKGEGTKVPALALDEINRILVKYRPKDDTDLPPPEWDRLEWDVHASFECEMQRYRDYAAIDGTSVLRLSPRKQDAAAFYSELANEPNLLTRAVLYDAAGTKVQAVYLGRFDLAWDKNGKGTEPPILYFGTPPTGGNVTVVLQRVFDNGQPIKVTTVREREQDDFGDGEEYWQFLPTTPMPAKRFHHLKLIHPTLAERADQLIVAVSFIGDVEFSYAQGASSIEAAIQTTLVHPAPVAEQSMRSVPDEFLDDLKNFNCLNIFHSWGNRVREHLNPKREDFPVYEETTSDHTLYTYHVRFETPATPDIDQTRQVVDARGFFAELYGQLGSDRTLEFDAEHTYGTHVDLLEQSGVSADFDFPIVLPTDVDNGEANRKDFLTVEYRGGKLGQPEEALLHVDLEFLRPASSTDQGAVSAHIAAWRAIAEATRVEAIQLFGRFRRFDHKPLLRAESNNSLSSALAVVEEFETMRWDITEDFARRARQWISGHLDDSSPIRVILTGPSQAKIFKACNVVEFRLQYTRAPETVPDPQGGWKLVRETRPIETNPNPFGKNGRKVREIKPSDEEYVQVRQRFEQFNQSLQTRAGPIKPSAEETPGAALVRRLLSGGGGDVTGAADWLVPEGLIDGAGQPAYAEFLPIGFRPVDRKSYLGQNAAYILRRIFTAFEAIIEGRTSKALMNDPAALSAHFGALEAVSENYERVIARLSELAWPLPDPEDETLNSKIKPIVDAARQPDHRLTKAIRARLVEEFRAAPTKFYDTKGYLYARLRGVMGVGVSSDLFKFTTNKLIRGFGEESLIEDDGATIQSALADLVDSEWFGFLEGLDDIDYDNEFYLTDVNLLTFEATIDALAKAEEEETELPVGGSLTVPIQDNTISVPRGDQKLTGSPDPTTPIELASRKALSNPVPLFIGFIDECQAANGLKDYVGVPLDLDELLKGQIVRLDSPSSATVRITNKPLTTGRSRRQDDFTLSAIYSIDGDEEAAQQAWPNAFQNDTFIFDVVADDYSPPTTATKETAAEPPEALKKVLDHLMIQSEVATIENIETLMSASSLDFLEGLIRPNFDAPISYDDLLAFQIRENASEDGVDICDVSARPHGISAEIYLLKPDAPEGSEADQGRFFLLANFEVVVWQRTAVTLVQGRNIGRRFAPEFGVVTETVAPQDPFSRSASLDLYNYEPVELPRETPLSARDLIQKLLIDEIGALLPESEVESDWADFDVSISVFGDQRPELPRAVLERGAINDSTMLPLPSKHGRRRHLFEVGDFERKETDWFDPEYDNAVVEFQWITPSNEMIFRIVNRRVRVQ